MAGLSPAEILLAVAIGATVECLVFALGSELIIRLLMTNLALGIAVVVAIFLVVLLYFIVSRYRKGRAQV
jgi:Ca2+/Na+ antiporter